MYPVTDIPCVELSLVKGLDPKQHIKIGKALAELRKENVLILGSGFSFHNHQVMLSPNAPAIDVQNEAFETWLIETSTSTSLTAEEREQRLSQWRAAPSANYCHPREEHLIPSHVFYGCSETQAELIYVDQIMNKQASA